MLLLPKSIVAFTCWLCWHKNTMSSILTQVPVLLSCGFVVLHQPFRLLAVWTRQQLEQQCSCKCNLPTLVHHTCLQPIANIWAPLTCSLMSLMAWSRHNPLIDLNTTPCHFTVNSNDYASYMEVEVWALIAPPRLYSQWWHVLFPKCWGWTMALIIFWD